MFSPLADLYLAAIRFAVCLSQLLIGDRCSDDRCFEWEHFDSGSGLFQYPLGEILI